MIDLSMLSSAELFFFWFHLVGIVFGLCAISYIVGDIVVSERLKKQFSKERINMKKHIRMLEKDVAVMPTLYVTPGIESVVCRSNISRLEILEARRLEYEGTIISRARDVTVHHLMRKLERRVNVSVSEDKFSGGLEVLASIWIADERASSEAETGQCNSRERTGSMARFRY